MTTTKVVPRLHVMVPHHTALAPDDAPLHTDDFAGTRGQGRRLEGFQLNFVPPIQGLSMQYMAHLQDTGDTPFVNEGQFVGTRGQARRLEGFVIQLTGPVANQFEISYMAHLQDTGDTQWFQNGDFCGTRGQGRRVEGICVKLTTKHDPRHLPFTGIIRAR